MAEGEFVHSPLTSDVNYLFPNMKQPFWTAARRRIPVFSTTHDCMCIFGLQLRLVLTTDDQMLDPHDPY
jgi:hypothetical protein